MRRTAAAAARVVICCAASYIRSRAVVRSERASCQTFRVRSAYISAIDAVCALATAVSYAMSI